MAKENLNKIFLSAGIPYRAKDRDSIYFNTADVIAIRDSIRALATVVVPQAHLIWGGQPAFTPLIRFVMEKMNADVKDHITLYQSNFFRHDFPEDTFYFENVVITDEKNNIPDSLTEMRKAMVNNNNFSAGIFIGGMDGVEKEYQLFRKAHPTALALPIASTGAAAKRIFEEFRPEFDDRLKSDYAYMALFRELLKEYL